MENGISSWRRWRFSKGSLIEFPFAGKTEEVLGVSASHAAELALGQAKTIKAYLSERRKDGFCPELNEPAVLAQIEKEMLTALRLSPWEDWVILYHDGRVEVRTIKDARNIQTLLLKDLEGEIRGVMSEVEYEMVQEQLEDRF